MTMKTLTAIAVAASFFTIATATAEAGDRRHGGHHTERHKHERHTQHRHKKWRHKGHNFSIHFGYEEPYRMCGYFKRKANYTGSIYWWRKYRRCIARYY